MLKLFKKQPIVEAGIVSALWAVLLLYNKTGGTGNVMTRENLDEAIKSGFLWGVLKRLETGNQFKGQSNV